MKQLIKDLEEKLQAETQQKETLNLAKAQVLLLSSFSSSLLLKVDWLVSFFFSPFLVNRVRNCFEEQLRRCEAEAEERTTSAEQPQTKLFSCLPFFFFLLFLSPSSDACVLQGQKELQDRKQQLVVFEEKYQNEVRARTEVCCVRLTMYFLSCSVFIQSLCLFPQQCEEHNTELLLESKSLQQQLESATNNNAILAQTNAKYENILEEREEVIKQTQKGLAKVLLLFVPSSFPLVKFPITV
jgi:hypothetical protein